MDAELASEMQHAHAAHTIILYGSLARGDATAESDIDVACFADVKEVVRDASSWNGRFLDAFVYPTETKPDIDLLKLLGGRVLLDARGLAQGFLDALAALDRAGPAKLSESEARMRRVWARKMLARIARDDLEARYRRHWLLFQLLEDHFALRGEWYRGAKRAFQDLDSETVRAFERALAPDATLSDLEALVERVSA